MYEAVKWTNRGQWGIQHTLFAIAVATGVTIDTIYTPLNKHKKTEPVKQSQNQRTNILNVPFNVK